MLKKISGKILLQPIQVSGMLKLHILQTFYEDIQIDDETNPGLPKKIKNLTAMLTA